LYLACKYRKDPKAALLVNTNLGGENAHRGAVLGGIVSLSCDCTVDEWFGQLVDYRAIQVEIAAWLSPFQDRKLDGSGVRQRFVLFGATCKTE
jgi:hypothetical protein